MSGFSRALALFIALALTRGAARAEDVELSLGGFLCARPFAPACAEAPETFRSPEAVAACQGEMERFVAATMAYRDCLERQIAGAMHQANDMIDRFRCRSQPAKPCPSAKSP